MCDQDIFSSCILREKITLKIHRLTCVFKTVIMIKLLVRLPQILQKKLFMILAVLLSSEIISLSSINTIFSVTIFLSEKKGFIVFQNFLLSEILRGSIFGTFIGAIPAAGSAIAVTIAYAQEMKLSKNPENFGKGEIKGVSAPEAANNACVW